MSVILAGDLAAVRISKVSVTARCLTVQGPWKDWIVSWTGHWN